MPDSETVLLRLERGCRVHLMARRTGMYDVTNARASIVITAMATGKIGLTGSVVGTST